MASFVRNNPINHEKFRIDVPENSSNPIRLAFLGDGRTGKTSIISKLCQGVYTDTYYPTIRTNSNLIAYMAESTNDAKILNPQFNEFNPHYLDLGKVVFSPVLKSLTSTVAMISKKGRAASDANGTEVIIHTKNDYYRSFSYKSELTNPTILPHITPIFVELIDTPAFKQNVVPFLESSLYINLDKDILKNLANEPRRDVLTMPLLVASGAGELNGAIDGYFFVYSAVPSYNPPSYDEISHATTPDDPLSTLVRLKISLDEAWREFITFKRNWEQGKEADIYSLKDALKHVFTNKNIDDLEVDKLNYRKIYKDLLVLPDDPYDANSQPPIWIVCTHIKDKLSSPTLIENGMNYAKTWKCGFIGVDVTDDLHTIISLMVREIVERKKQQKLRQLRAK